MGLGRSTPTPACNWRFHTKEDRPMPRPRILIADDEEGIRESLTLLLGETYDLVYARDGEEAWARLNREEPLHLVLLDIKMPKLDGIEILRRLRQAGNPLPIIMLTAYQSTDIAQEAVRLGATNYLPKPFERQALLTTIQQALAGASPHKR
jgi:CheY-like chemotaxis protein